MANDARAWRRRARTEDAIVARMRRRDRSVPIDIIRAVYHAFNQVLDAAEEHSAGLVMATLDDGAEDELAAERAEQKRERLAYERRRAEDPTPYVRDDSDPEQFASRAWLEKHNAQYDTPYVSDSAPDEVTSPIQLVLVPGRYASHLHKLVRQASRLYEDTDDYLGSLRARHHVQQLATARATQVFELRTHGETSVIHFILGLAAACYRAPRIEMRDYSVKQARTFARALEAWRDDVGIDAIADKLLNLLPGGKTHASCERAFRTFLTAFTRAASTGSAVFMTR